MEGNDEWWKYHLNLTIARIPSSLWFLVLFSQLWNKSVNEDQLNLHTSRHYHILIDTDQAGLWLLIFHNLNYAQISGGTKGRGTTRHWEPDLTRTRTTRFSTTSSPLITWCSWAPCLRKPTLVFLCTGARFFWRTQRRTTWAMRRGRLPSRVQSHANRWSFTERPCIIIYS